jgi:hypothetical protein
MTKRKNMSGVTKSIQFWVELNEVLQFAELLEKSGLANCILGTDSGAVLVEVDYDPENANDTEHVTSLQQLDIVQHLEYVD